MKKTKAGSEVERNLKELRHRQELESLRVYVEQACCFQPNHDPKTQPVTMEELKKLARVWKLHERRNFWKMNVDPKDPQKTDAMVTVLLQYVEDTKKYLLPDVQKLLAAGYPGDRGGFGGGLATTTMMSPAPPVDFRPSVTSPGGRSGTFAMANFMGRRFFNDSGTGRELVVQARYYRFPTTDTSIVLEETHEFPDSAPNSASGSSPDRRRSLAAPSPKKEPESSPRSRRAPVMRGSAAFNPVVALGNRARRLRDKHRILAQHLVNYSCSPECNSTTVNSQSVFTFVSVGETVDELAASCSLVAISNIAAMPHVRNILVEANLVHKFPVILSHAKPTPTVTWAAALLYYYFSIDLESENSIYSLSSGFLQANAASKAPSEEEEESTGPTLPEQQLQQQGQGQGQGQQGQALQGGVGKHRELKILTLYTLYNLIGKCIDSKTIAEMMMLIIRPFTNIEEEEDDDEDSSDSVSSSGSGSDDGDNDKDGKGKGGKSKDSKKDKRKPYDRQMAMVYLPLLHGVCEFGNIHMTLFGEDILELLCEAADHAESAKDHDIALLVAKILLSFFASRKEGETEHLSSPAAPHVARDESFFYLVEKLLEVKSMTVLRLTVRCLTVISGFVALRDVASDSTLISIVVEAIECRDLFPADIAVDLAKYFANICQPYSHEYLMRLVEEDGVQVALLQLLEKSEGNALLQSFASRALQNVVSDPVTCSLLATECLEPMIKAVKSHHDAAAVVVLYNISCVPECFDLLAHKGVHVTLLNLIPDTTSVESKARYLEVMLRMATRADCIENFLQERAIDKLLAELRGNKDNASANCLWASAVGIILALVSRRGHDLGEDDREAVVQLLKTVSNKQAPSKVIGMASVVLAHLSLTMQSFDRVDGVLRSILSLSSSETVLEAASVVLCNATCSDRFSAVLLQDGVYIKIMLDIMRARNSKAQVQLNIARALRTLCSFPRCVDLMLAPPMQASGWVVPGSTPSLAPPSPTKRGGDTALADLVVIALLVATAEEIKLVCSETFYNMLCHRETRMRLIKGDLFWAIAKLSREGVNEQIKSAGLRALFDLSCDAIHIPTLREHHVLAFLHEAAFSGRSPPTQPFLDTCMRVFVNIARQFTGRLVPHEILACIKMCSDSLRRSSVLSTVRHAITLLLYCARQTPAEADGPGHRGFASLSLSRLPDSPGENPRGVTSHPGLDTEFSQLLKGLTDAGRRGGGGHEGQPQSSSPRPGSPPTALQAQAQAQAQGSSKDLSESSSSSSPSSPAPGHAAAAAAAAQEAEATQQICRGEDLVAVLHASRAVWKMCPKARLYVTRLTWLISKSTFFVRKVPLGPGPGLGPASSVGRTGIEGEGADGRTKTKRGAGGGALSSSSSSSVMSVVLFEAYGANAIASHELPSQAAESCENVCGTLLHYVLQDQATPLDVSSLPIFHVCLADAFGTRRPGTSAGDARGPGPFPLEVRAQALAILATCVDLMLSNEGTAAAAAATAAGALSSSLGSTAQSASPAEAPLAVISRELVGRLLTSEMLNSPSTRDNVLSSTLSLSASPSHAAFLLDHGVFKLLTTDLQGFTFPNETMNRFVSSVLRNMARHTTLIGSLLERPDAETGLVTLVFLMLELTRLDTVCLDLCALLYYGARFRLRDGPGVTDAIKSSLVLDLTERIVAISKDPAVIRITKFVVGEVLEKFSHGVGVSPAFVQAMHAEMLNAGPGAAAAVVAEMNEVGFTTAQDLAPLDSITYPVAYLRAQRVAEGALEVMEEESSMWHAYLVRESVGVLGMAGPGLGSESAPSSPSRPSTKEGGGPLTLTQTGPSDSTAANVAVSANNSNNSNSSNLVVEPATAITVCDLVVTDALIQPGSGAKWDKVDKPFSCVGLPAPGEFEQDLLIEAEGVLEDDDGDVEEEEDEEEEEKGGGGEAKFDGGGDGGDTVGDGNLLGYANGGGEQDAADSVVFPGTPVADRRGVTWQA